MHKQCILGLSSGREREGEGKGWGGGGKEKGAGDELGWNLSRLYMGWYFQNAVDS